MGGVLDGLGCLIVRVYRVYLWLCFACISKGIDSVGVMDMNWVTVRLGEGNQLFVNQRHH